MRVEGSRLLAESVKVSGFQINGILKIKLLYAGANDLPAPSS